MDRKTAKSAFITSLPVLMGYSTMGAAFGILLSQAGYGPAWALLMSVTIFSGSLQFAAVDILRSAPPLIEVALLSLLVNIRYCVYGISLIEKFRRYGWRKFYLIFGLTDETYALLVRDREHHGTAQRDFMLGVCFFDHLYWIFGSVAGAIAGTLLTCNTRGIDFTMTALFLVILTEQCLERKNRIPALIGAAATVAALVCFGPERMLVPAILAIIGILLVLRRRLEPREVQP